MTNNRNFRLIDPLISSLGTEDLILLDDKPYLVGVQYNCSERFKKYILAAAKAYLLGNTIDYVLKKYSDSWDFQTDDPTFQLMNIIIDSTKRKLRESCDHMDKHLHTNTPALISSSAALTRVIMTFKAAILLVRNSFLFESAVMCRLILEQLSWAYSIHDSHDKDFLKVLPTKSIGKTKKLIPFIGKLYSALSNLSHISPELTSDYIIPGGPYVLLKSPKSILHACHLLILADAFATVGLAITKFSNQQLDVDQSLNQKPKLSPQDSALEFLRKNQEQIEALTGIHLDPLLTIISK